jgi:hypothetical protein
VGVGDWLKTDYATWSTLGIRDKDSFLAWIDKACVWFRTIQHFANGAKHFGSSEDFKAERVGAPPFMLDELEAGLDEGAWDGPTLYIAEIQGAGCLLIDYAESTDPYKLRTAAALLDVVVRFWREFFFRYHPDPEARVEVREWRLL